jgi:hypothetical protein
LTDLEVLGCPWTEGRRPIRKSFGKELPWFQKLGFLHSELNVVIVFFDMLTVRV